MSAPLLPEIFGNYALQDFAEVIAPEGISWLPQTIGWLWLGLVILGLALYHGWRRAKHWYRNRYRREALLRLKALANRNDPGEIIADINRVLKITALVAYSRANVAKLSGQNWVDFLNQQCEQPPFSTEQMELLANAVYRQQETNSQHSQLLQASTLWVEQHREPLLDGAGHA